MLANGASFATIQQQLQTTAPTILRWKQRFLTAGLDGLDTYHPGQSATVLTPALKARILSATRNKRNGDSGALEGRMQRQILVGFLREHGSGRNVGYWKPATISLV